MRERHSVTSFIMSENEILILLRSDIVRNYKSMWEGISGCIDENHTADEQALVEIQQETGLSNEDIKLLRKGRPQVFNDNILRVKKVIQPYLFLVTDRTKIKIDWEHKSLRWIKPEDIDNYETVPNLKATLTRVLI